MVLGHCLVRGVNMVGISLWGEGAETEAVEAWVPRNFSILTCDSHCASPTETRCPGKHKSSKFHRDCREDGCNFGDGESRVHIFSPGQ